MKYSFLFFFNSVLLGFGLAMDAFSVSVADGLNEPEMRKFRMNLIAGMYSFCQFLMPLIGWICVRTIAIKFTLFQKFIPYIALGLLLYIGIGMILEAAKKTQKQNERNNLSFKRLVVQGIATSIDALSVGFATSEYTLVMALVSSVIIAAITFILCVSGLVLGRKIGTKFAGRAGIAGGVILIGIGIEIFIRGVFCL